MKENLLKHGKDVDKEETSIYVEMLVKNQISIKKKAQMKDGSKSLAKGFKMSQEPRFNNLSFTEKIDNFMIINRI